MLGVTRCEQRLDSAARADVGGARARATDGELGERHRRRLHTGDVIVRDVGAALRAGVGGQVVVAVRHEPDACPRDGSRRREQAAALQPRHLDRGRGLGEPLRIDLGAEQEEPREGREGVVAQAT